MLGVYNYTVILTYFGMLVSFVGISFTVNGDFKSALTCLMISGVCDMFDGKIASTKVRTQQEKRFGIQIDSLSDLICFGVLPAMFICRAASENPKTQQPREVYLGLPVTTVALLLPLLVGVCGMAGRSLYWAGPALLLAMALAFLTPFELKKPALLGKLGMLLCGGAGLLILLVGVNL